MAQPEARELGRLLASRRAHVNLIPYNPVAGLPFERPDQEAISRFVAILREWNVSVTVRKTKGRAIDAACGQLRRRVDQDQVGVRVLAGESIVKNDLGLCTRPESQAVRSVDAP